MLTKKLLITAMFALMMAAGAAQAGGDAAAGEGKAASCAGCHGAEGKGDPSNPPIAGLDEAEHVAILKAYVSGEREHAMMKMFVENLSDQDLADIAAYYATL